MRFDELFSVAFKCASILEESATAANAVANFSEYLKNNCNGDPQQILLYLDAADAIAVKSGAQFRKKPTEIRALFQENGNLLNTLAQFLFWLQFKKQIKYNVKELAAQLSDGSTWASSFNPNGKPSGQSLLKIVEEWENTPEGTLCKSLFGTSGDQYGQSAVQSGALFYKLSQVLEMSDTLAPGIEILTNYPLHEATAWAIASKEGNASQVADPVKAAGNYLRIFFTYPERASKWLSKTALTDVKQHGGTVTSILTSDPTSNLPKKYPLVASLKNVVNHAFDLDKEGGKEITSSIEEMCTHLINITQATLTYIKKEVEESTGASGGRNMSLNQANHVAASRKIYYANDEGNPQGELSNKGSGMGFDEHIIDANLLAKIYCNLLLGSNQVVTLEDLEVAYYNVLPGQAEDGTPEHDAAIEEMNARLDRAYKAMGNDTSLEVSSLKDLEKWCVIIKASADYTAIINILQKLDVPMQTKSAQEIVGGFAGMKNMRDAAI